MNVNRFISFISLSMITIEAITSDFQVEVTNPNSWRLSFASCHDYPGDYASEGGEAGMGKPFNWDLIAQRHPEAFIWGGDIIYGDFPKEMMWTPFPFSLFLPIIPIKNIPFKPSNPKKLNHMYNSLKADKGYSALVNQLGGKGSPRHFGTWDDHDYGLNDGDKTLSIKDESKQAFLSFFDAKENDPRKNRKGVYSSTLFSGSSSDDDDNRSVLVIALDMRYDKDPYDVQDGDFLGEEQWLWLEETLRTSQARSHVFISSLQLLVEGREPISECWSDFPKKREKFLKLLHDMKVKSPLVVSGDVHFAEIMETSCGYHGNKNGGVVELTTSGLTHAWGIGMGHLNNELNFITAIAMFLYQHIFPWGYQSKSINQSVGQSSQDYYLGFNFGEIEFDWKLNHAIVKILDGESGDVIIEKIYPFISLDMGNQDNNQEENQDSQDSICRPKRGEVSKLRLLIGYLGCLIAVICLIIAKPLLVYLLIRTLYRMLLGSSNEKVKSN